MGWGKVAAIRANSQVRDAFVAYKLTLPHVGHVADMTNVLLPNSDIDLTYKLRRTRRVDRDVA